MQLQKRLVHLVMAAAEARPDSPVQARHLVNVVRFTAGGKDITSLGPEHN
jgi:hypothetical protein